MRVLWSMWRVVGPIFIPTHMRNLPHHPPHAPHAGQTSTTGLRARIAHGAGCPAEQFGQQYVVVLPRRESR